MPGLAVLIISMCPVQKLSYSRAGELSVRTARLPIDEYMVKKINTKNFHSKILAVNQGEQHTSCFFSPHVFFLTNEVSLSLCPQCSTSCWLTVTRVAGHKPCMQGSPRGRVMLLHQVIPRHFLQHRLWINDVVYMSVAHEDNERRRYVVFTWEELTHWFTTDSNLLFKVSTGELREYHRLVLIWPQEQHRKTACI